MKKAFKLLAAALVIAAAVILWYVFHTEGKSPVELVTEPVNSGRLYSIINASGTLEPEELVNVGAQVTGKLMAFGIDADGKTVDYRSKVTKGMVLAKIDEVLYEAELQEAEASKQQSEAAILSAEANLKQREAALKLSERNWQRAQELYPKKALSKSDYDAAESDFLSASAAIAVAQADLEQAKARLAIAEAGLTKARRNLSYCVISSPVDGIIIDRRVSVGQTLVSNMSASSIFLIATDLSKMQVWASVNEADIGYIKPGMAVLFTVDAFPGREFSGVVHKVRLNATMSQNVVTYVVEIAADNPDGMLLPYLTANVRFIKEQVDDALYVSNAALRFTPPSEEMVVPEQRQEFMAVSAPGERRLFLDAGNGMVRFVKVKTGINNGSNCEVISPELKPGDRVVNAVQLQNAASGNGNKSPFLPTAPSRNRNSAKAAK